MIKNFLSIAIFVLFLSLPTFVHAYYTIADEAAVSAKEYAESGEYEKAIIEYNRVISDGYVNRGYSNIAVGKIEEGLNDFDEALKVNPNESRAYLGKGNFLRDEGKYEEAIEEYSKAISINDDFVMWAYNNRGRVYAKLGQYNEALKDLNKAVGIDPNEKAYSEFREYIIKQLGNPK